MGANGGRMTVIRPKFGERRARVREIFRTGIKITREQVNYEIGEPDLHGVPLATRTEIVEGAVLVPIWNGHKKPQDYVYGSIYEAIRGQQYTRDEYEASDGEIASLRISVRVAEDAIKMFPRWVGMSREERGRHNELLRFLDVKHTRARNPQKREARLQFGFAMEEYDSLGRTNPGARAARTVAGRNCLLLRSAQVVALMQAIGPRRTALLSELDRQWSEGWIRVWKELGDAREALGGSVCERQGNGVSRRLILALDAAERALEMIDVEPYLSGRYQLLSELGSARSNIHRKRWGRAYEDISRSLEGIQFKRAGRELHSVVCAFTFCTSPVRSLSIVPLSCGIALRDLVGDFRTHFSKLSEKHLQRPIKTEVDTLLGAAQDALVGPATLARLEKAAEYLKGALAYL